MKGPPRDPVVALGSECCRCQVLLLVGGLLGVDKGHTGAGQDVESEVAAAFDPVVVLFGQDGSDEADRGVAVGEDADDIGAEGIRSRRFRDPAGTISARGTPLTGMERKRRWRRSDAAS
jgi:hypothetical protein